MKAKIGNLVADVWEINREDSEENYAPWLKSAINKNLVGWADEFPEGIGNLLSGFLMRKYEKEKRSTVPSMSEEKRKEFIVKSYTVAPTVGFIGDYLVYNEQFPEKYRIISKKSFEKHYQLIEA